MICSLWPCPRPRCFFFNDTATTEIYTLSLHDALPISATAAWSASRPWPASTSSPSGGRSEEHTSELQSRENLVCRLLLEKKKIEPVVFLSSLKCSPDMTATTAECTK